MDYPEDKGHRLLQSTGSYIPIQTP